MITRAITVWCDEKYDSEGTDDCIQWHEEQVATVSEARLIGRTLGWRFIDGRDYCPKHAKEHRSL